MQDFKRQIQGSAVTHGTGAFKRKNHGSQRQKHQPCIGIRPPVISAVRKLSLHYGDKYLSRRTRSQKSPSNPYFLCCRYFFIIFIKIKVGKAIDAQDKAYQNRQSKKPVPHKQKRFKAGTKHRTQKQNYSVYTSVPYQLQNAHNDANRRSRPEESLKKIRFLFTAFSLPFCPGLTNFFV